MTHKCAASAVPKTLEFSGVRPTQSKDGGQVGDSPSPSGTCSASTSCPSRAAVNLVAAVMAFMDAEIAKGMSSLVSAARSACESWGNARQQVGDGRLEVHAGTPTRTRC